MASLFTEVQFRNLPALLEVREDQDCFEIPVNGVRYV
jgi:hypothetical protein